LEQLESLSEKEYVEPYGLGLVHVALDDREKALRKIEQAVAIRSVWSSV